MNTALQHAIILYEQGRFDLAVPRFREALALEPNHAGAHGLLALSLHGSDGPWASKLSEAKCHAEEALRLSPNNACWHYVLSVVLSECLDWEPSYKPNTPLKGLKAIPSVSATRALQAIREAISLDPHDPMYHAQHAYMRLVFENWVEALVATNAGLALNPVHRVCLRWRALALFGLERDSEADDVMKQLLAAHPDDPMVHSDCGFAYLRRHQPTQANNSFREALRIDPMLEEAHAGLSWSDSQSEMAATREGLPPRSHDQEILDFIRSDQAAPAWKVCVLVVLLLPLVIWSVLDYLGLPNPLINFLAWFFH